MSTPRFTTADDDGVRFYHIAGLALPSVTSILKVLGKPALELWAARHGVEAAVAWCLAHPGELPPAELRTGFIQTATGIADRAAALGDAVHSAVEHRILGRPAPAGGWPKPIAGHMRQFDDFLAAVRPEFTATEETVFSRGGRTGRYAGTLDFRAHIDGRHVTGDLKTGTAVRSSYALQGAAYRWAPERLVDGNAAPNVETEGVMVLRLRPRSWQLHELDSSEPVLRSFLFCAGAFHFQHSLADAVVGPAIYRNGGAAAEAA